MRRTSVFVFAAVATLAVDGPVANRLSRPTPFAMLEGAEFTALGWDLPDQGRAVKAVADGAVDGAFDPRHLEKLAGTGYRAKWHELRYRYYGIDWDISALQLTPEHPVAGLPTLAIVHGGSANWYEFFVDPLNGPGLAQYLAQRIPVVLITIPGNYAHGGWSEPVFDRRVPAYRLDRALSADEARVRNAVFTFSLIAAGVRQLLEKATSGPLLLLGHSTGGELQFMLKTSSLGARFHGRSIGWGTGGPASLTKEIDEAFGERADRVVSYGRYPRVDTLRARDAAGYVASAYIGPLNPVVGGSPLAVAQGWFKAEARRRPQFKQVLQDMEHQGFLEHRARLEREMREAVGGARYGVDVEAAIADLFAPSRSALNGYARMAWIVGRLDNGHWDENPEAAREYQVALRFRKANPDAAIRVLAIDAALTHYGHIERPKALAATLVDAIDWLRQ